MTLKAMRFGMQYGCAKSAAEVHDDQTIRMVPEQLPLSVCIQNGDNEKRAKITGMRIMGGDADTISLSDEEKGA